MAGRVPSGSCFRVRCRSCKKTVFSEVRRIGNPEAAELLVHIKSCQPNLRLETSDLGTILKHFDVVPA